ncbi:LytTR family DNA-binding domain-containing protein [Anaerorhabdus sp.]|uniref:LytTR family DNA-binding domain-containing protein n=1 Tax=Anaerorhabdus sp. TaxID=1872524 RepID=UPI002FC65395
MKLLIEQSNDVQEVEIKITCGYMDDRLKRLIEQIKLFSFSLVGYLDGVTTPIALEDIYYFDTVDNNVFIYTSNKVYTSDKKLYELEEFLTNSPFIRISKSCIVNTNYVTSVKAHFNGRIETTLENNEKLIVSKHYIQDFKRKFVF